MNLYTCMQTHSTCYKGTTKMQIKGILWHSTGANNPNLKRYVQPYEGDPNYNADIAKLGKNAYKNDWNHVSRNAGLNAWIGKFADGTVGTVQTMPWDFKPWGCGSGKNGSCNNGWIQFEICEDNLSNKDYAQKVWNEAIDLSVYLCKMYNLNPLGTAKCGNVDVPVITCHNDSAKYGCGCNHSDINHWFPKILGKNMDNARKEIAERLNGTVEQPVTTPAEEEINMKSIKKGSKGNAVKVWQIIVGCTADGIFGAITHGNTVKFQQKNGLPQTGVVGDKEWKIGLESLK